MEVSGRLNKIKNLRIAPNRFAQAQAHTHKHKTYTYTHVKHSLSNTQKKRTTGKNFFSRSHSKSVRNKRKALALGSLATPLHPSQKKDARLQLSSRDESHDLVI